MATETVTTYDAQGRQIEQRTVEVPAEEGNRRDLHTAARNALATNRTFVGLASPTNAQSAAQVKALTRQVNALIRLALGQLDGTD